ncbi:MAG: mannonate dehydratase [Bacteroidales bacterium]
MENRLKHIEKTWRWFGATDSIRLEEIRSIGVEGIVTALHHIPNGEVWPAEEIDSLRKEIESHGMHWTVVESLPIHEEIKWGGPRRDELVLNYIRSLENLAACGLKTVVYNFMPVIDWIRTDLHHRLPDGSEVLYFRRIDFVVFDLFILEREGAATEYPPEVRDEARRRYQALGPDGAAALVDTVIIRTQGFIDGISASRPDEAVALFRERLAPYRDMDPDRLFGHLRHFLEAVLPVAERLGIRLAIHADDPPGPVLGLPRIVGNETDLERLFRELPSPANGLTFCAGSFSADPRNDVTRLVRRFADRIGFIHLRSTRTLGNGDFYEAGHLEGNVDMPALVKAILEEVRRRGPDVRLPMRVDHGARILSDFQRDHHPGYPLLGRMKALAEMSGLIAGLEREF